jgi:diacylglycerol kinase
MKNFSFALAGIRTAFASESSLRIQLIAAFFVTGLGFYLEISSTEWLILILCIGFVFTAELLNTAIEYLTDLISPGYHQTAGKVKDIGAGAVLISAITSGIIGAIIFIPKIFG